MNLQQITDSAVKAFCEHLAIASRFNPKEPIYGEENRRDLENLKVLFTSSIKKAVEVAYKDLAEDIEKQVMKTTNTYIDIRKGLNSSDFYAWNEALALVTSLIEKKKSEFIKNNK